MTLYFKVLSEKNKDLLEVAAKKQYTFMVPLAKFITPNMLLRPFYDNHTFYECEYDPNFFINLNGKVIEYKNNQINTFLGFKKPMVFNALEETMREVNNTSIKMISIDNVIDETIYNTNTASVSNAPKKELLKRYNNKEDYVRYFNNLIKANEDLKDIDLYLADLINKLENNYILIRNHVPSYYKYFQEYVNEFKYYLYNRLARFKVDENFNLIIHELTESLVFNKISNFLTNNLKQFNQEEEGDLKTKMFNMKNEYSFKSDSIFNECKFRLAIAEIRKLSNVVAPFEKLVNYILLTP